MPGLRRVVVKKNFVAVVAEREEQAIAAAAALKVRVERRAAAGVRDPLRGSRAAAPAKTTNRVLINTKDVDATLAKGAKKVAAEYRYPIQMHGPMGASAAQAWVQGNTAVVWSHTQNVYGRAGDARDGAQHPGAEHPRHLRRGLGRLRPDQRRRRRRSTRRSSPRRSAGRSRCSTCAPTTTRARTTAQPYVHQMQGAVDTAGTVAAWDAESWSAARGGRPGPPGERRRRAS